MTTVAIDFGTSNTVVSIIEADTKAPKTLRFPGICRLLKMKNKEGKTWEIPVVPTLLFVQESNQLVLGEKVRMQRLGVSQPYRLFKSFKRDLVADFQTPGRKIDGLNYDSALVAEKFIKEIWQQILQQNIKPDQVIFTIPVGAFERYLDWFRDLGNSLQVSKIQLVDESTAAALSYAVKSPGSLVLVVDFGGGTLDLSLVRTVKLSPTYSPQRNETIVQAKVLAKSDAYVGGEDIDIWIVEDYLRRISASPEEVGEVGWQNLLEIAEKLKIRLSQEKEAKESWWNEEDFKSHELHLSREQLEEILENQQLLEQLRRTLDEVVAIALSKGISKTEIEKVVLVGGSCLIPAVQQLINSYFGRNKVSLDKPFEAVSHGALALTQVKQLDDYLRHSYAIRLWEPYNQNYTYYPLFEQGTKYPCSLTLKLKVAIEGQREIRLDIGELAQKAAAEVIFDNWGRMMSSKLAQQLEYRSLESNHQEVCVAYLDPPGKPGNDRVSVQFEVDKNRVLLATVRDLETEKLLIKRKAIAKLS
ncbi:MAG: Hsp70 family protein [Gomphosphaeria aponina SAG 52.96 = DSM 107014]|uniref:Hsp70 family protein n=1 Tax=Gomphosphaeria aponina SAG 52.96 = DSM 107014 TaxID=1521640 RepID=A0A941GSJ3_9CHRO|nr:Hsp70 family protein [Gomphosphaeria aponina SAG 52.96 = DSM 107014]